MENLAQTLAQGVSKMPKLKNPARNLFQLHKRKTRDHATPDTPEDVPPVPVVEAEPVVPEKPERPVAVEPSMAGFSDTPPKVPGTALLARADALPRFSPWIGGDFFICIYVKEGLDLFPAVAVRPATCDSFVRVSLQRPNSLPFEEAETRVLTRNCYPMWEECLPFPLNNMPEDTLITLRVLDKDIGHFNSFLGTVSLPLKEALGSICALGQEKIYRMPLMDRQGNPRKRGELVFGVSVVAQHEYREMRAVITAIQDPDQVHDCLRDYCLHLKLHGVRELMGLASNALTSLKAEFNICSTEVRRPLVGELVAGGVDLHDVEFVVPLGPAFRDGDTLRGKTRMQFGDVKVELMSGKTRLAKTQIPIWDVPFRREGLGLRGAAAADTRRAGSAGDTGDSSEGEGEEGETESEAGAPTPQVEASPEPGTEKKTFFCNLTTNIANVVAATALARCSETGMGAIAGSAKPGDLSATSNTVLDTGSKPSDTSSVHSRVHASDASTTVLAPAGGSKQLGNGVGSPIAAAAAGSSSGSLLAPAGADAVTIVTSPGGGAVHPSSPSCTASAAAGPPALWDGKKYIRRMERLDRSLVRPPVLVMSMQLVKAPPPDPSQDGLGRSSLGPTLSTVSGGAGGGSAGGGLDFDAADVESPAEALAAPAPLPVPVADFVVCAGPHAVVKAAYGDGSELNEKVMALEKMTEAKISPWGPDPEGKALCARNLSYMKPTPVGPTAVQAQQKIMTKGDGGFYIVQFVTPNVPPVGLCVKVEVQVVGQHIGPNKTRVTVSCTLHWLKTGMMVNMLKGKVEDGTPKDTRKYFETMRDGLAGKFGVAGGAAAAAAPGAAGAAIEAAGAAATAPYGAVAAASGGGAGLAALLGSPATLAVVGVLGLLVLLLLVALMRVSSELGSSMRALEGVSRELRGVAGALEALAGQLAGVRNGAGAASAGGMCASAAAEAGL